MPNELEALVSTEAWLGAMLEAEAALAIAQAEVGVVPRFSATAIRDACHLERVDVERVVAHSATAGTLAAPLVLALREAVGGAHAMQVHLGATSQDIEDSAAMLVTARAAKFIQGQLLAAGDRCAVLANEHRATPMVARTLLQHAVPTTFGRKAAGWLAGITAAHATLRGMVQELPAQLGGPGGTLAGMRGRGLDVLEAYSRKLGLCCPTIPWHGMRAPIATIAAALDLTVGMSSKIALDLVLLSQAEVGEVDLMEAAGGSSSMPHKRNPIGPVLAIAAARQAHGLASTLTSLLAQEHERAAGAWQAERHALSEAIVLSGAAVAHTRRSLDGLAVVPGRLTENLARTRGSILSGSLSDALSVHLSHDEAFALAEDLSRRASDQQRSLSEIAAEDQGVSRHLSDVEIDAALNIEESLETAEVLVDRAVSAWEGERRR